MSATGRGCVKTRSRENGLEFHFTGRAWGGKPLRLATITLRRRAERCSQNLTTGVFTQPRSLAVSNSWPGTRPSARRVKASGRDTQRWVRWAERARRDLSPTRCEDPAQCRCIECCEPRKERRIRSPPGSLPRRARNLPGDPQCGVPVVTPRFDSGQLAGHGANLVPSHLVNGAGWYVARYQVLPYPSRSAQARS